MSYETVINYTKEIETILVDMGAEGKGLHTKVGSVEDLLNERTVKSIRFIASIRNQLLHDNNFNLTPELLSDFENACEVVISELTYEEIEEVEEDSYNNSSSPDSLDLLEKFGIALGVGLGALGAALLYSFIKEK